MKDYGKSSHAEEWFVVYKCEVSRNLWSSGAKLQITQFSNVSGLYTCTIEHGFISTANE